MAYIWFNNVLAALGKKINFESISNIYGNSFMKDSQKIVTSANPLVKGAGKGSSSIMQLAGNIRVIDSGNDGSSVKRAEDSLGDLSWAQELFDKL